MAHQNPEAFRAAAAAIEAANLARANAANANQEAANQAAAEAAALAAAGVGAPVLMYALPTPPVAPVAPVGFWASFDRFLTREYHWNWATAAFLLALAAFLLALLSTSFGFSLANTKASEASVIAVGTTATGAAKDAAAANAKADKALADASANHADVASALATAKAADQKADKALAIKPVEVHKHFHPVKVVQAPPQFLPPQVVQQQPPQFLPPQQLPPQVAPVAAYTCQVTDVKGRILADFLSGANPKGLIVTSGDQCLKERDEYYRNHPEYRLVTRETRQ